MKEIIPLKVYLLLTLLLLVALTTHVCAQQNYSGQVLDQASNTPIPGVNVMLLKAKITTTTNKEGYFAIESDSIPSNDTLVFSYVGYTTYRIAASSFENNGIITLKGSNTSLEQVDITKRKIQTTRLNPFDIGNVSGLYSQVPIPNVTQYAYAKLFTSPNEGAKLLNIELGRRIFHHPPPSPETNFLRELAKTNPRTRFKVHILLADSVNAMPKQVVYTKSIELENFAKWVTIDLSAENIQVPGKHFFIAIEWLRIPLNEIVELGNFARIGKVKKNGFVVLDTVSQYKIHYQPAIVSYSTKLGPPYYTKDSRGNWILGYTGSELALSATIKY
ncbi:MAG: carboxypeptidase-like regulatory domain-containing protein [Pedobacter sp.]|nr:MAG: carboxypeptidase-like regulatory domain-containing protein [Pedobacter sp.]